MRKVVTEGPGVPGAVASDPEAPSPSQREVFKAVFERILTMVNNKEGELYGPDGSPGEWPSFCRLYL
jgi:hypothetical protein